MVDYHLVCQYSGNLRIWIIRKTLSLSGNGLDENGMLNTSTYDYVDNLYVLLLLRAGIIFLFIFLVAMTIIMKNIFKKIVIYIIFIY